MKEANRDILVLTNSNLSQRELDQQVAHLNKLLYVAESWTSFCIAHEVIDVNMHRILQKPSLIQRAVRDKISMARPFVFVNNKN